MSEILCMHYLKCKDSKNDNKCNIRCKKYKEMIGSIRRPDLGRQHNPVIRTVKSCSQPDG